MKSIKNAENHRKESVPYTVVQVKVQDKYISFLISGSNRGYGKGVDKIQALSSESSLSDFKPPATFYLHLPFHLLSLSRFVNKKGTSSPSWPLSARGKRTPE